MFCATILAIVLALPVEDLAPPDAAVRVGMTRVQVEKIIRPRKIVEVACGDYSYGYTCEYVDLDMSVTYGNDDRVKHVSPKQKR